MSEIKCWVVSSLKRIFLSDMPQRKALVLDSALNEQFSFQVAVRMQSGDPVKVKAEIEDAAGFAVRVRRIGYVPLPHFNSKTPITELDGKGKIPGYIADPLFEENEVLLPGGETHAFWFSIMPTRKTKPGPARISVVLTPKNGKAQKVGVTVNIHDVIIKKRHNFPVTNWFYNDCLVAQHGCEMYDRKHWKLLESYFKNLSSHFQDTVLTPMFSPPLDGERDSTQLLKITKNSKGGYKFDWKLVRRYVRLAQSCGIENFEWAHLFSQWGAKYALQITEGPAAEGAALWPKNTASLSKTYREFLTQFLPAFKRFLDAEKIMDKSFFHLSDEPYEADIERYVKCREMLADLAPWLKVMDATATTNLAKRGVLDVPVPSVKVALNFLKQGLDSSWCYYCCGPRGKYIQRLMDTPLAKIRMNGWLFYRFPFNGFLHWGYNYWNRFQTTEPVDPFTVSDAHAWPHWAYGDCFMVYPGKNGPIDSIRWEVFAESLQDYALLQSLDTERDGKMLRELKSFSNFPKTEKWLISTRKKLLSQKK